MDDVIVVCRFKEFLKEFLGDIDFENNQNYYLQDYIKGREEEFKKRYKYQNLYKYNNGEYVEPLPSCVDVIKKLNEKYDVYIVTTFVWKHDVIDAATNLKNKFEYLNYWFPFIDSNKFIFMTDKTKIQYDIGIDDRLLNLNSCNRKILFTDFRNKIISDEKLEKEGIKRANNWLEIQEELCDI